MAKRPNVKDSPGMILYWQGRLPRGRHGKVWRYYWWPPRTWAWDVLSSPEPLRGYIATGNRRTALGAFIASWIRAWGRSWHA